VKWEKNLNDGLTLFGEISNYEQKLPIAKQIAQKANDGDVIGFGSGSTSFLAAKAIAERVEKEGLHIYAIPTSG
jgi:ribose 5-phosphate isomerase A